MYEVERIVSPEVCKKLIEYNIDTTLKFLITDIQKLIEITDLSCEELLEIRIKISKNVHNPNKIIRAIDIVPWRRLSTGCIAINSLIRGGIPVNGIIEIFGCSGVGKTQFCLQLALQAQLPLHKNGLETGVVYICTEDVFPSKRFHHLANIFKAKHNLSENDFESSVFLKHVTDIQQLQNCLSTELPILFRKENIGLVVVDSIAGPFRGENENEVLARSREIIDLVTKLKIINEEFKAAVVCTNQVTEDIIKNKTEPCLGLVWTNSINYRCQITRNNNSTLREFEVVFSPDVPTGRCSFSITEEGLQNEDCMEY
ncbi:DNA repair protein XRCC3 [Diorhabda carinulata]|uniref:DNA repair protein XRCC3 n=1 Tax=Diorhabda carinulata TaxID=1163345 RepID=UPI0025A186FD|nr:DNA repair protein XRCC3 [Diorhabda carinulata]